MTFYIKDPDATLPFGVDWSEWLAAEDDDTIATSTWTAPDGVTVGSSSHSDTATTVWLSAGTVGERYAVVNHVTTAAGREEDRTLMVWVQER